MKNDANIAAIYCRLSKEDTEKLNVGDDSESIQNQKLILMDYALQQGFMIYKVYADDDYGGFSDRPQFKLMLQDAENRLFNIILCKHQSRFTRDMELVEKYIHGYFNLWGIRFISLTDHVDTAVKGGKKSRQINGLINEWYCEDLSENVKAVIKAKREQGQFVGAYVSYGYLKDPKDRHKLIIDEEAAEVVRKIFDMYLSGVGIHTIAVQLTEWKIPTPTQHKEKIGVNYKNANSNQFSLQYGAWAVNTVRRILRNETYIGNMVQGRERSSSYKTKKLVAVPKDDWAIVENTHEPIIDKKKFETVQRLIDHKRTLFYDSEADVYKSPHLLAGKVVCLDCGSALHRSGASKDGKDRFLRCQLASKTKLRDCTSHYVSQNKLQSIVAEKIKQFISSALQSDGYSEIVTGVFDEICNAARVIELKKKQLEEAEVKIKRIQRDSAMAYSDRLNGIITEEDFLSFKQVFNEDKKAMMTRRTNLMEEIADCEESLNNKASIEKLIKKYKSIDVLTHEVINDFIRTIQVGEKDPVTNEQEIIINWNF